jgi:hypothetical protein
MHLDSNSARSHAAELAALRAAAREQAATSRPVDVRAESRTASPRLTASTQANGFRPAMAGYATAIRIGREPLVRSTSTTDHVLAVRRPPDDWPVHTRLPPVTA